MTLAALHSPANELLGLVFPSDVEPRHRLAMILHVYLDESGTHAASTTIAVAGYLSTQEYWEEFDRQWKAVLADYGIPFFRMSKWSNRAGDFEGWTDEKRMACLKRLTDVIAAHVIAKTGAAFPIKHFKEKLSEKAKRLTTNPYALAVQSCFIDTAQLIKKSDSLREASIAYILESGANGAGAIADLFALNYRDEIQRDHLRLSSLSFQDKRRFTPLQAADIMAYELYKAHERRISRNPRASRENILAMLNQVKLGKCGAYENVADLNKMLAHAPELSERR